MAKNALILNLVKCKLILKARKMKDRVPPLLDWHNSNRCLTFEICAYAFTVTQNSIVISRTIKP